MNIQIPCRRQTYIFINQFTIKWDAIISLQGSMLVDDVDKKEYKMYSVVRN